MTAPTHGKREAVGPADAAQARAAAAVLQDEFGVPVAVYDAATGAAVCLPEARDGRAAFSSAGLREAAAADQVRLTPLGNGGYRLLLPVGRPGGPPLVAVAALRALAGPGGEAEEQARLTRWGRAVGERLRGADALRAGRRREDDLRGQLKGAWEVNLTLERLLRHLRVHRDPAANRKHILEAAFPFLDAQAVVWVPDDPYAPVAAHGAVPWAEQDTRRLAALVGKAPEVRETGLLRWAAPREAPWGGSFPGLASLLALAAHPGHGVGWVLALNKTAPAGAGDEAAGFRTADAAALAPFVALLGMQARAFERYQDLKDLLVGLTRALTSAIDAKDPYTYGHSERVGRIALELGRELGLEEDELNDIYLAGLLHDVGKIGIRDAVLGKHGTLTPEETEHIQQHVTIGHGILKDLRQIRSLLPGVLYHHERWDGAGYPEGLAGERIPLLARILAVADSYDAMSTTRPYRNALPLARVDEILTEGAGRQWDRQVIEAFVRCKLRLRAIRERGVGESLRHALDGALRSNEHSHPGLGERKLTTA